MPQIRSIVLSEELLSVDKSRLQKEIDKLNVFGFRFRDWHNPPGFIILEFTDAPFEDIESKDFEYGYPTLDMAAAIVQQGKGNSWDGGMPSTYADYAKAPITDEQPHDV